MTIYIILTRRTNFYSPASYAIQYRLVTLMAKPGPVSAKDIEAVTIPYYIGYDYLGISISDPINLQIDQKANIFYLYHYFLNAYNLYFKELEPTSIFRRLLYDYIIHKLYIDLQIVSRDSSCLFYKQTFYHLCGLYLVKIKLLQREDEDLNKLRKSQYILFLQVKSRLYISQLMFSMKQTRLDF